MSDFHHTRVYGSIKDCLPLLKLCAENGSIPDVLFTVGRAYVVGVSHHSIIYIRRGPMDRVDVSFDPFLFSRKLGKQAARSLTRFMTDLQTPARSVRWTPLFYAEDAAKITAAVS